MPPYTIDPNLTEITLAMYEQARLDSKAKQDADRVAAEVNAASYVYAQLNDGTFAVLPVNNHRIDYASGMVRSQEAGAVVGVVLSRDQIPLNQTIRFGLPLERPEPCVVRAVNAAGLPE